MTAQDFLYWLLLFSSSNRVTLFFFLLLLFLPLLTGDRLRPLLQCHLPDQDWGSPTAVFSEPYYRGAGCAADAGFWGPGSFGHWDLLCFPGRGCRPRRDHAPGAGNCHSSHHGRSPWMFYQQSSFTLSVTCSKYRVTVSSFIVAPRNWQSLDYNGKDSNVLLCIINAAKVFFARHTSPLKYKPLAVWRPLFHRCLFMEPELWNCAASLHGTPQAPVPEPLPFCSSRFQSAILPLWWRLWMKKAPENSPPQPTGWPAKKIFLWDVVLHLSTKTP